VLDYGVLAGGTGAYLQRYNASKVGEKWMIKNKALDLNKTYTVAFSDYLLKGFDIPFLKEDHKEVFSVYRPSETEISYDIRKSVISFLEN
ncbi:MAG: bifunctional metallophosphatase/5'-nucleotidase, partial [Tenacibaculum sp.]